MKNRMFRSPWLAGCLGLLLAACGPAPVPPVEEPGGVTSVDDPYQNADYPWSYVAPPGQINTLGLTPGVNNLSFESVLSAKNGWGPIELGRSNGGPLANDGQPLTLSGKTYARGFGTHAPSELVYSLKSQGAVCTRFTASIGVDDEVGEQGSVIFQVFLDGKKVYDSGVLTGSSSTQQVDVPISAQQELRLVVTDAGDGKEYDHADWADPTIICQAAPAPPASGTLDASFGSGGIVPGGGVSAQLEPDGGLLAVTSNGDVVIRRLTASGVTTLTTTDLGGIDSASALLRQPDGKFIVVGTSVSSGVGRFAAVRYNADLSLDSSFGSAGKLTTPVGEGAQAFAAALQPDGKLLIAGTAQQIGIPPYSRSSLDLAVARYTAAGQPDPGFGNGGVVLRGFDGLSGEASDDAARAIVVQPDGKLLIAGKSDAEGGSQGRRGLLTRLNSDGSLDSSFGSGGAVIGDPNGVSNYSTYNAAALTGDGSVVVVGYMGRFFNDAAVWRFADSGTLLKSAVRDFSAGDLGTQNVLGQVLALPGGKLLVGGLSVADAAAPPGYALSRLNADLSVDTSFNKTGKLLTKLPVLMADGLSVNGDAETPLGTLLVQPDGKLVVVSGQTMRLYP